MLDNLYLVVTLIISILLVSFGILVLFRNTKSSLNKVFFAFTLFISVWLVANSLSASATIDKSLALPANHITLFAGAMTLLFLGLFIKDLTGSKSKRSWRVFLCYSVLASFLSLTNLVLIDIYPVDDIYQINFGNMAFIYFAYLVYAFVFPLLVLLKYRKHKISTHERKTVDTILRGFALTISGVIVTNAILPFVLDIFIFTSVGSFFVIFLVFSLGYSTIKHRLFDLRLVAIRSLGYVLSILSLVALYGFISFWLVNVMLDGRISLGAQRSTYTVMAVVLALTFQPLKRFFDRWTNRFFYQDAYDPQTLVDELNRVLVSTIDLNKMLKLSGEVVASNIKPEFCAFGLKETETKKQRIIGNLPVKISSSDVDFVRGITTEIDHKVIVADHLDDSNKALKSTMRKNNVAVLVRLTSDVSSEGVGYIILGAKKSGNIYNSQDIKVLEIVANSLVIAIDNALRFEEIQNFNVSLKTEVEQATRRLQRANDKLVALDQTKDDFISMASHQLRTPLTSVKGYISMVLEGDAGKVNNDQKELLGQAFVSSQRMVYLISDLLNVSRLRTGKFVIETTPINLADIIESEVAQLRETASARGLKLIYKKPKDFPILMLDETKIRQVLTNYMDNAIYYTPKGGRIEVDLKDTKESIELTVADSGIGVPRSEQHNLFSKFFRAGNAKKARPDGTGLGLFMAKKVIIAQGGAIIFRSTEGKGSTFGFTFIKSKLKPIK